MKSSKIKGEKIMENVIEDKPVKKTTSKKKILPKKIEKIKLTDEIYNLIIKRNKEEGKPFHVLCDEYNVSESSFNYQRSKLKDFQPIKKKIHKVVKSAENERIQELESQLNLLKGIYMDLLIKYESLRKK